MTATNLHLVVCHECQAPVDPVRAKAKIIGVNIVRVCASCKIGCTVSASLPIEQRDDEHAGESVALADAQERIAPAPQLLVDVSLRKRSLPWKSAAGAAVLVIGLPVVALALSSDGNHSDQAITTALVQERPVTKLLSLRSGNVELFEPVASTLVDETSWVHPIAGSEERIPKKGTRLFRAERPGNRPAECGQGHCGVDLDAPRGTPVVAVRPGVIEKVIDDKDASGGRYVWIRHDDIGLRTEYFHFDRVAPDLQIGGTVVEGQWLGTLGRSGIENSQPHLHFAVRDIDRNSRYVDPKPFLGDAQIIGLLDMRLASGDSGDET